MEVGNDLARALRTGRYLHESARLAPRAKALHQGARRHPHLVARSKVEPALADAVRCVALSARAESESGDDAERTVALDRFEQTYQDAKAALLAAIVGGRSSVESTETLLDDLSSTRRMVEQLVKADRLLRSPERAKAIEQEDRDEAGRSAPESRVSPEEQMGTINL
jgi:hypothetical protein